MLSLSSSSGVVFIMIDSGTSLWYKGIQTNPSFLIILSVIAYLVSRTSNDFLLDFVILINVQSFFKLRPTELIFKISFS